MMVVTTEAAFERWEGLTMLPSGVSQYPNRPFPEHAYHPPTDQEKGEDDE
jgi:hypothetical protein